MTKRELNYLLYRNSRLAFRLIEPKSSFKVSYLFFSKNIAKRQEKLSRMQFDELLSKEIDLILFGDNIGKAKPIIPL